MRVKRDLERDRYRWVYVDVDVGMSSKYINNKKKKDCILLNNKRFRVSYLKFS